MEYVINKLGVTGITTIGRCYQTHIVYQGDPIELQIMIDLNHQVTYNMSIRNEVVVKNASLIEVEDSDDEYF